jgi:hypothetical protein
VSGAAAARTLCIVLFGWASRVAAVGELQTHHIPHPWPHSPAHPTRKRAQQRHGEPTRCRQQRRSARPHSASGQHGRATRRCCCAGRPPGLLRVCSDGGTSGRVHADQRCRAHRRHAGCGGGGAAAAAGQHCQHQRCCRSRGWRGGAAAAAAAAAKAAQAQGRAAHGLPGRGLPCACDARRSLVQKLLPLRRAVSATQHTAPQQPGTHLTHATHATTHHATRATRATTPRTRHRRQGMQRNPGCRTIESELEGALVKAGAVSQQNAGSFSKVCARVRVWAECVCVCVSGWCALGGGGGGWAAGPSCCLCHTRGALETAN